MKRVIPLMMLFAAAFASTSYADDSASIGTITYTVLSSPTTNMTVSDNGFGGGVGPYNFSFSGPATGAGVGLQTQSVLQGGLPGFCMDFVTDVNYNSPQASTIYALDGSGMIPTGGKQDVMKLNSADAKIVQLVGFYIHENAMSLDGFGGAASALPLTNAASSPTVYTNPNVIGLQLALWQVINGPTFNADLASYSGADPTAAKAAADFLLNNYGSFTQNALGVEVIVPTNDVQIQGVVFTSALTTAVGTPEPTGSVALAGLGLCLLPIGFFWLRQRRMAV